MRLRSALAVQVVLAATTLALGACSASSGDDNGRNNGTGSTGSGSGGRTSTGQGGMTQLAFGGSTGSGAGPSTNNCDGKLTGIIRDFDPLTHPDFEPGDTHILAPVVHNKQTIAETGIVSGTLSSEFKPIYAKDANSGSQTTFGKTWFDSWFKDGPLNKSQELSIQFQPADASGVATFDNMGKQFFPIDGQLLGNWKYYPPGSGTCSDSKITTCPDSGGGLHNYSFTFEFHAKFKYNKGMKFTFSGDDDVWVFINGQLAVDLGGIHAKSVATVDLDTRGLTADQEYQLDFFMAERHVSQSNFRIDTSLFFTDCNVQVPR